MIGKVTLTQEQAGSLEARLKDMQGDKAWLLDTHASTRNGWGGHYKHLNDLSQADLARALLIGYEVEPKFQLRDWAKMVFSDGRQVIGQIDTFAFDDIIFGYLDEDSEWQRCRTHRDDAEIPTPEEIKAEKERQWWAKHGRGVWELKQGDVLMATRRKIYEVTADPKSHRFDCYTGNDECDFDIEECKRDNWEVICFHEDRKDVRHD